MKAISEGLIGIDTEPAKMLGFTSDKFHESSYLWRNGKTITISAIIAKQRGMFRQLIETIQKNGFDFEIPTPCKRMREIGRKQKWNLCQKNTEHGVVDILTNKSAEIISERQKYKFTVIDGQTGEYPDVEKIAMDEDWAANLVYCDIEGFAIKEDGSLVLADECGNFAHCPEGRFEVVLDIPALLNVLEEQNALLESVLADNIRIGDLSEAILFENEELKTERYCHYKPGEAMPDVDGWYWVRRENEKLLIVEFDLELRTKWQFNPGEGLIEAIGPIPEPEGENER